MATVVFVKDEQLKRKLGMIITDDLVGHTSCLYEYETFDEVIADLARRLNILYHDYIEVQ
ncbi:MAG: hypothetical protein JJE25_05225 [Bacteroidia bacterium]|nr:hypothetical protein [Bacteroidia bacterium]